MTDKKDPFNYVALNKRNESKVILNRLQEIQQEILAQRDMRGIVVQHIDNGMLTPLQGLMISNHKDEVRIVMAQLLTIFARFEDVTPELLSSSITLNMLTSFDEPDDIRLYWYFSFLNTAIRHATTLIEIKVVVEEIFRKVTPLMLDLEKFATAPSAPQQKFPSKIDCYVQLGLLLQGIVVQGDIFAKDETNYFLKFAEANLVPLLENCLKALNTSLPPAGDTGAGGGTAAGAAGAGTDAVDEKKKKKQVAGLMSSALFLLVGSKEEKADSLKSIDFAGYANEMRDALKRSKGASSSSGSCSSDDASAEEEDDPLAKEIIPTLTARNALLLVSSQRAPVIDPGMPAYLCYNNTNHTINGKVITFSSQVLTALCAGVTTGITRLNLKMNYHPGNNTYIGYIAHTNFYEHLTNNYCPGQSNNSFSFRQDGYVFYNGSSNAGNAPYTTANTLISIEIDFNQRFAFLFLNTQQQSLYFGGIPAVNIPAIHAYNTSQIEFLSFERLPALTAKVQGTVYNVQ